MPDSLAVLCSDTVSITQSALSKHVITKSRHAAVLTAVSSQCTFWRRHFLQFFILRQGRNVHP